jgi:hypothetical protein
MIVLSPNLSASELHLHSVLPTFVLYFTPHIYVYRMSQEECARLPYVKVYRYNPQHLCPKLNGYGDNDQRKVWYMVLVLPHPFLV